MYHNSQSILIHIRHVLFFLQSHSHQISICLDVYVMSNCLKIQTCAVNMGSWNSKSYNLFENICSASVEHVFTITLYATCTYHHTVCYMYLPPHCMLHVLTTTLYATCTYHHTVCYMYLPSHCSRVMQSTVCLVINHTFRIIV